MKKTAIITLMHGANYGGLLQSYALQQTLKTLGRESEILDYPMFQNRRKLRRLTRFLGPTLSSMLENVLELRHGNWTLHREMMRFRQQELTLSSRIHTPQELKKTTESYSSVIVGSDQVWNLSWFVPEYFLDFVPAGIRRISYAACCGSRYLIPEERQTVLKTMLEKFDAVSVRNDLTAEMVTSLTGQKPFIAADPTLLYPWPQYPLPSGLSERGYIFFYSLSCEALKKNLSAIQEFSQKQALPIVAICSSVLQPWLPNFADVEVRDPSVWEWLGALQHAKYVFTDSFHGTLFSLKNRIPAWNFLGRTKTFERLAYVAARYGIQPACCDAAEVEESLAAQNDAYFERVSKAVANHSEESLKWLKKHVVDA